jgi:RES domain-containing protein
MLYCASTLSLACLEALVHVSIDELPPDYVYSIAEVPVSSGVETAAWAHGFLNDEKRTREAGREWADSRRTLALEVPSVIIQIEFNVLLNPGHPDFEAVKWSQPVPFVFDQRLLSRLRASS